MRGASTESVHVKPEYPDNREASLVHVAWVLSDALGDLVVGCVGEWVP